MNLPLFTRSIYFWLFLVAFVATIISKNLVAAYLCGMFYGFACRDYSVAKTEERFRQEQMLFRLST